MRGVAKTDRTQPAHAASQDSSARSPAEAMVHTPLGRTAEMIYAGPVMQARAAALRAAFGSALEPLPVVQRAAAPNRTGLPDPLKAEVEARSGLAMDDVRVHRDSPKPAQVQAHAYAQGTHIHLAPGQEKHLPHEAWHVVQQKQGRVKPTLQMKGVAINDDAALEREAERNGAAVAAQRRTEVSPWRMIGAPLLQAPGSWTAVRLPMQRAIDAKIDSYVQNRQKVKDQNGRQGTIVAISGQQYEVEFGAGTAAAEKQLVNAAELDLVEEQSAAASFVAAASVQGTSVSSGDAKGKAEGSASATAASSAAAESPAFQATHLRVSVGSDKKKWMIALLDASGKEIAKKDNVGNPQVLDYLKGKNSQITAQAYTSPKVGTYPLKANPDIKGVLKQAYDLALEKRKEQEGFSKYAQALASVPQKPGEVLSQAAIFKRLQDLNNQKKPPQKAGHPSIVMTKIRLFAPITIIVAGVARQITHLYTQPGNQTEIRCYLGNDEGAYQRVHTSLTLDKASSSHTMVQTGATVAIPAAREGGTRIGFDAEEEKGKGFAGRKMSIRSKKQCEVRDWITGEEFSTLKPDQQAGCTLLAQRFNAALDEVCADINKGDADKRDVTGIDADFKILDDEWLFAGGKAATPELESAHSKTPKESGATDLMSGAGQSATQSTATQSTATQSTAAQSGATQSGSAQSGGVKSVDKASATTE